MVIDDCWQEHHRLNEYNGGPWTKGNEKFPDMKALADKLVQKGVRPGIWVRLLLNEDENIKNEWRLSHNNCIDPTNPEALNYIKEDITSASLITLPFRFTPLPPQRTSKNKVIPKESTCQKHIADGLTFTP